MASPEIKLPDGSSKLSERDIETGSLNSSHGLKFAKKPVTGGETSILPSSVEDHPIIHRYLSFETELPSPTNLGPAPDGSILPDHPDLQDFISPFTWSKSRKTLITWLSCAITMVTAYTAGSYSSASAQMSKYWNVGEVAITLGITTFTIGFATAPMILAPFSELNGRRPVFIATGVLFVICQLCCAVTRSYPGMLVARFFAGVGGSTFSTMVGGVISDIYHAQGKQCRRAADESAWF